MPSSTREEYRRHSRSSSDTHIPDLEKGDARPDKEEEEVVEGKVSISVLHSANTTRTLLLRSLETLTSACDLVRTMQVINGVQAKLSEHRVVGDCTIIANHQFENIQSRN
jgi:uncharacterized protein YkvS